MRENSSKVLEQEPNTMHLATYLSNEQIQDLVTQVELLISNDKLTWTFDTSLFPRQHKKLTSSLNGTSLQITCCNLQNPKSHNILIMNDFIIEESQRINVLSSIVLESLKVKAQQAMTRKVHAMVDDFMTKVRHFHL